MSTLTPGTKPTVSSKERPLLPCPFCGGPAETDSQQGYRSLSTGRIGSAAAVYCTGSCSASMTLCDADVPELSSEDRLNVLVENWNRRLPIEASHRAALDAAESILRYAPQINTNVNGTKPNMTTNRALNLVRGALGNKPTESETLPAASFQDRVLLWMRNCFMRSDAMDPVHRSFRFAEEALELAQATGCSQNDAHRLVDYVYNRPVGEASQEGGGVMVTLAALLTSLGLNLNECGEGELERCIENTDRIRAKDLAKPERSPLPGPTSVKASEGQS